MAWQYHAINFLNLLPSLFTFKGDIFMYYWNKANERSLIAKKHAELMENTKTDLIKSSVAESKIYESCAVQAPTAPATFKLLNTDIVSHKSFLLMS